MPQPQARPSSSSSSSSSSSDSPPPEPSQTKTHQLAIPLRQSDSTLHLHLTTYSHALVLMLASSTSGLPSLPALPTDSATEPPPTSSGGAASPLTSLVAAVPDLTHPAKPQPTTTPLYADPATVDFATRLARVVATKCQKVGRGRMVYVGVAGGIGFWSEDEAEAVRGVVGVVERVA